MEELLLFAMGIDDVRDVFRADPELSGRLRGIAAARFPGRHPDSHRGILSRVGPLLRRHPATEVDPTRPLTGDLDLLLAGGHIPAARALPCWRLLVTFLEELATAHAGVVLKDLDALEFDLARAGLPSQFALRNLARRPLGIPLKPLPGQVAGYARHTHAAATLAALEDALQPVDDSPSAVPRPPDEFLSILTVAAKSETLDLVVVGLPR